VDEEEDEDDATILLEPEIPTKEYSFHVTFGLKKKQRVNPFSLFHNLALEMINLDSSFKIHAYDCQASDLWPLASPNDIPTAEDLAQQYFVQSQINKQNTQVTMIFCITSRYSHIEWQTQLATYLSNNRILLVKQHKLKALETACIGFIAKKHPHYTHLNHFEDYLCDTLPNHTPQFIICHIKPRISASFTEAIKTEVLDIETTPNMLPFWMTSINTPFP
jgi:hypothetical protein